MALSVFRKIMSLNTGDNQGVRALAVDRQLTTLKDVFGELILPFRVDVMDWAVTTEVLQRRIEGTFVGSGERELLMKQLMEAEMFRPLGNRCLGLFFAD